MMSVNYNCTRKLDACQLLLEKINKRELIVCFLACFVIVIVVCFLESEFCGLM
jgi:predicted MFS family arabinose efflux permease